MADLDIRRTGGAHRRARRALAVLLASVAVAACSDRSPTNDPTGAGGATGAGGTTPTSARIGRAPDPIRADGAVRRTVLANGLTVLVRENDGPAGQIELRLAVDAGSIVEDPDQLGAAHFVEHMLFNGTQRYPRNELTATLGRLGVEFGPDINAFTSEDQTVYELQVLARDDLLVTGLDVLAEWASQATIRQEDVDAERGVVLEELRLRELGAAGRSSQALQDLLVAGTPYAGRDPIGTAASIAVLDAPTLRRFYEDWYRPDLMAVVVVGDVDADAVEELVADRFGSLEGPTSPRPRPRPNANAGLAPGPDATVLAQPDTPWASVSIGFPGPHPVARTDADERASLVAARGFVFSLAGDARLDEIEELSRRYIGTLPSSARTPTFVDRLPGPTPHATRLVQVGTDAQATVALRLEAATPAADAATRVQASVLELVLRTRLVDDVREHRGATYSPWVDVAVIDWPQPRVVTTVWIGCDPARVDEVTAATRATIDDLRTYGPTVDELAAAVEQRVADLSFISNEQLAWALRSYAEHPELDPVDEDRRVGFAEDADRLLLWRQAATWWSADRSVLVQQTPATTAAPAAPAA